MQDLTFRVLEKTLFSDDQREGENKSISFRSVFLANVIY